MITLDNQFIGSVDKSAQEIMFENRKLSKEANEKRKKKKKSGSSVSKQNQADRWNEKKVRKRTCGLVIRNNTEIVCFFKKCQNCQQKEIAHSNNNNNIESEQRNSKKRKFESMEEQQHNTSVVDALNRFRKKQKQK